MKKIVFSVMATSALAAVIATGNAEASSNTHNVQSGDSLWKIASKYQTSVQQLKTWNNLTTDLIYPNQKLIVSSNSSGSTSSSNTPTTPPTSSNGQTSNSSTNSSSSSSYVVKSGDSLSKIAQAHKTTVANIAQLNNISNIHSIRVGQVLTITKGSVSQTGNPTTPPVAPPVTPPPVSPPATGETAYTVVSGDSLSKIAVKYGTTITKIMQDNGLSSTFLQIGQKLKINASSLNNSGSGTVTTPPVADASMQAYYTKVLNIAKQYQGVPYVWGGSSPSGFDCSGYIYYVYKNAGIKVSRTNAEGYYSRSFYVDSPQPGDLVFFNNTYKKGISHMGIYVGNGQFIHAGSNGVTISKLSESYWKTRFDGYKRLYDFM